MYTNMRTHKQSNHTHVLMKVYILVLQLNNDKTILLWSVCILKKKIHVTTGWWIVKMSYCLFLKGFFTNGLLLLYWTFDI